MRTTQVVAINDITNVRTGENMTVMVLERETGETFQLPLRTTEDELARLLGFLFASNGVAYEQAEDTGDQGNEAVLQQSRAQQPQTVGGHYGYDTSYDASFKKPSRRDEVYEDDFDGGGGIGQF